MYRFETKNQKKNYREWTLTQRGISSEFGTNYPILKLFLKTHSAGQVATSMPKTSSICLAILVELRLVQIQTGP